MAEQRQIAGPVYLDGIHSSGRCAGKFGTKNVFLKHGIPGETVSFIPGKRKQGFRGGECTGGNFGIAIPPGSLLQALPAVWWLSLAAYTI